MKRVFLFFVTAVITLSLGLTGCVKEDPAKALEVDLNRTATIDGRVLVFELEDEGIWSVAKSVPMSARVRYTDLNEFAASGTYYTVDFQTDAFGEFKVDVPVGANGSTRVEIRLHQFKSKVTPPVGDDINVIWGVENKTEWIRPGETRFIRWEITRATNGWTQDTKKDDDV